ncbi:hypothetical protein [Marinicella sp. W31]|uniref:hypothetical protein n=1 Tax=Marinicella sp. W31 TaxID=3023713 RepID=UPI0037579FCA
MEVILSILAAVATLKLSFSWFFDDQEDLMESVRFWFTPDIISIFRGEFWRDELSSFKLIIWLMIGIGIGFATHRFLIS